MPSTNEHLDLARKLWQFVEDYPLAKLVEAQIEIAVASAYWSSLHHIDAVLALRVINKHPGADSERCREMTRLGGSMHGIVRYHRLLKDRYDEAMYRAQPITQIDFEAEIVEAHTEVRAKTERMLGRWAEQELS